ncbi:protease SohB [Psychrobium sp. 1_MG-2023]|uniref:protease SohB n=1 Tax=Psychrobium sp. 1_MG-2023 TaxID=3062624 RepID=UPI000C33DE5B|nr:protease SohB [Psychrobium sp. 1_MG-2023]MDP2560203.1 protease SohB [Psychrobium sp. 1_MG-2023]PKF57014.1 protease SohB [Alteromonadales bacterium alter-6D02]
MEFLYQYGLFLAEIVTIVVAIIIVVVAVIAAASKGKSETGTLEIINLSEGLTQSSDMLRSEIMNKDDYKAFTKEQKKQKKSGQVLQGNTYVIDFKGSMDAHQVDSLRREITAIVQVATKNDEVLLRLESPGGVVHGYGLAASQLLRITQREIPLTVTVDKVAASGGYMMACIANRIVAAPFSIIGSIGVIAQIPNFNKVLKKNDIDFEQVTAGEYKRTLTMFGENTDQDREKFQSEIDDVHGLFKQHVNRNRPQLDIDKVATGETWFGEQAIGLGLIDELSTSDDYLLARAKEKNVYQIKYVLPKTLSEKLGKAASVSLESSLYNVWQRLSQWRSF